MIESGKRETGDGRRFLLLIFLLSLFTFPVSRSLYAAHIVLKSVSVTDTGGVGRSGFSSSEKIGFTGVTQNDSAEAGSIQFTYSVTDPSGKVVFQHSGNSIPGTVGEGASSVSQIPIVQFYTGPGDYLLTVSAKGSVSGDQAIGTAKFFVTSPIVILTFPPNGARDMVEQPPTFRWVATGATKYRFYVDDDAAFFNTIFTAETLLTDFTYPVEPSDVRQKLQGGTIYYWKVEGLNADGSVVAQTAVPYNFTLQASAVSPTSRDIAIKDITQDPADPGIKIDVSVKNQGGKSESSIPINLYVNGVPVVPAQQVAFLGPSETAIVPFSIQKPERPDLVLTASTDFFDDYNKNNLLTKFITLGGGGVPQEPVAVEGNISVEGSPDEGVGTCSIKFIPEAGNPIEALTDPVGGYRIKIVPGKYKIRLAHPEFISPPEKLVEIVPGKRHEFSFALIYKGKAKILGGVSKKEEGKQKPLGNAKIRFEGPAKGEVKANSGGEYKIEDLPLGEYRLVASADGFKESEPVKVSVEKNKAYPNTDFVLEKGEKEEKEKKKEEKIDMSAARRALAGIAQFLPPDVASQLRGFRVSDIQADPGVDVVKILEAIKSGKAKVTSAVVEEAR